MSDLYWAAGLAIVVGVATVAVVSGLLAGLWAVDLLRRAPAVGAVGLALVAAATVNVLVPRTCDRRPAGDGTQVEVVNRPVLAVLAEDGDCFASGLGQVALIAHLGVAASVVARLPSAGRHRSPLPLR